MASFVSLGQISEVNIARRGYKKFGITRIFTGMNAVRDAIVLYFVLWRDPP